MDRYCPDPERDVACRLRLCRTRASADTESAVCTGVVMVVFGVLHSGGPSGSIESAGSAAGSSLDAAS